MDFNTQNINKSEIRWSTEDQVQVKSYSCSFCKRGFSNAQALGGHMNIHRRDRAKLKQSSEENLLSLDISIKTNNSNTIDQNDPVDLEEKILFQLDSGQEKHARSYKSPFTFSHNDDQRGNMLIGSTELPRHLPSFVFGQRIEEKKGDLDLELRLGLHPQESPTFNTRAFF